MFGYVKPRADDLLVKEYAFFRAAYCGVCRAMRKETGFFSSFALSYDIVFLAACRMLLTDRHTCAKRCRCIAHPCRARSCLTENEALPFAARISAVLLYEKCLDDKKDKGKGRMRAGCDADLVIFDPETVTDTADYPGCGRPNAAPQGIRCVIVEGKIAARGGIATGAMAGRAIALHGVEAMRQAQ